MADPKYLAWIDLETTGSDESQDPIIEFAMIVTEPVAPFEQVRCMDRVVRPDGQKWSHRLNPTVLEMHVSNGLLADVFSGEAVTIGEADSAATGCLHSLGKPHDFLIAGSGVAHFDRRFIAAQMPKLDRFLQYAALDVGVLRRTLKAAQVTVPDREHGDKTHRALEDITDHIYEMRHFAEHFGRR